MPVAVGMGMGFDFRMQNVEKIDPAVLSIIPGKKSISGSRYISCSKSVYSVQRSSLSFNRMYTAPKSDMSLGTTSYVSEVLIEMAY